MKTAEFNHLYRADGKFAKCKTPMQRFSEKVNKLGPVPAHVPKLGNCWQWMAFEYGGYGSFALNGTHGISAHRASWILHHGEIKNGLRVLHKCDNGMCVNPKHLFLGTQKENMEDCASKGRTRKFSKAEPKCKLAPADVLEIRRLISKSVSIRRIGTMFGVHHSCISNIKVGKTWRSLANTLTNVDSKFSNAEKAAIARSLDNATTLTNGGEGK